jgi:hypothetical protein
MGKSIWGHSFLQRDEDEILRSRESGMPPVDSSKLALVLMKGNITVG